MNCMYSHGKKDTNPYNISTMEIAKEVLWFSVGQLASKLQAVKAGE